MSELSEGYNIIGLSQVNKATLPSIICFSLFHYSELQPQPQLGGLRLVNSYESFCGFILCAFIICILFLTSTLILFYFQGNMVARGILEFCDGSPPVRIQLNFSDIAFMFFLF